MNKFPVCYINGKFVPMSVAKIPVDKAGVLRGYGVFESVRATGDATFMLPRYLKRLRKSAHLLGLKVPLTDAEIETVVSKLIKINKFPLSKIRIVLTGGKLIGNLALDNKSSDFFILVWPRQILPKNIYSKGIKLIATEYARELPEAKSNNYLLAISLEPKKLKAKAYEILYTWQGSVLECSTSNFFIIKKNRLITAKDNVLKGVTRELVIKNAKKVGVAVEERNISVKELGVADEAFITATYKGIVPVVKIDGAKIGNGTVGPVTKLLMSLHNPTLAKPTPLKHP